MKDKPLVGNGKGTQKDSKRADCEVLHQQVQMLVNVCYRGKMRSLQGMHIRTMLELCTLAITLTLDILFMRDCDIAYARVLSLLLCV